MDSNSEVEESQSEAESPIPAECPKEIENQSEAEEAAPCAENTADSEDIYEGENTDHSDCEDVEPGVSDDRFEQMRIETERTRQEIWNVFQNLDDPELRDALKDIEDYKASLNMNNNISKRKAPVKKRKRGETFDATFRFSGQVPTERRRSARLAGREPVPLNETVSNVDSEAENTIENLEKIIHPPTKKRKVSPRKATTGAVPVLVKAEDVTDQMINNIATNSVKVYSDSGTTCHQCRQKTQDQKTICRSGHCPGIHGQVCGPCLRNRYGEQVAVALRDPDWHCPYCRGFCNCSFCRGRAGKRPTGILAPVAHEMGFASVREFLEHLQGNADDPDQEPDDIDQDAETNHDEKVEDDSDEKVKDDADKKDEDDSDEKDEYDTNENKLVTKTTEKDEDDSDEKDEDDSDEKDEDDSDEKDEYDTAEKKLHTKTIEKDEDDSDEKVKDDADKKDEDDSDEKDEGDSDEKELVTKTIEKDEGDADKKDDSNGKDENEYIENQETEFKVSFENNVSNITNEKDHDLEAEKNGPLQEIEAFQGFSENVDEVITNVEQRLIVSNQVNKEMTLTMEQNETIDSSSNPINRSPVCFKLQERRSTLLCYHYTKENNKVEKTNSTVQLGYGSAKPLQQLPKNNDEEVGPSTSKKAGSTSKKSATQGASKKWTLSSKKKGKKTSVDTSDESDSSTPKKKPRKPRKPKSPQTFRDRLFASHHRKPNESARPKPEKFIPGLDDVPYYNQKYYRLN